MTDQNTENGQNDEPLIDPEVKEELEEIPGENPMLVEYAGNGDGENDSISFADKWFPGGSEWQGKTDITADQAHALSLVRAMTEYYDELEDLEPFFESLITNYEQYLTSVEGKAREQQVSILRSMFGSGGDLEEAQRSALTAAFANPDDNED